MPANPKPSNTTEMPDWGESAATEDIVPVPSLKRLVGWLVGERPAHGYFNWLFRCYGRWCAYVDTFEQNAFTWPLKQIFTGGADLGAKLTVTAGGAEITGATTITGPATITGNASVGGTLSSAGAATVLSLASTNGVTAGSLTTAGALTAASASVTNDAVAGTQKAVTAFSYFAAKTMPPAYLSAARLTCGRGTGGPPQHSPVISADVAYYTSVIAEPFTLYGQAPVPAGAIITSVQVEVLNNDGASRNVNCYVSLWSGSGNTALANTAVASNVNVSVPSNNTRAWNTVTIGAGPFTVPASGYVSVSLTVPSTTSDNTLNIYGVRIAYNLTTLQPSA